MPAACHPVLGDDPGCSAWQPTGQTLCFHPGQYWKAGIVCNQTNVHFSNFRRPADMAIPATDMPGGGRPRHAGNRPSPCENQILEMFADRLGVAQVMKLVNQAVEQRFLFMPAHLAKRDGHGVGQFSANGRPINFHLDRLFSFRQVVPGLHFSGRQNDMAGSFRFKHETAADHVTQGAVLPNPVPCKTKLF